jgi:hypothetical protein
MQLTSPGKKRGPGCSGALEAVAAEDEAADAADAEARAGTDAEAEAEEAVGDDGEAYDAEEAQEEGSGEMLVGRAEWVGGGGWTVGMIAKNASKFF